jgi:GxxExxY protein
LAIAAFRVLVPEVTKARKLGNLPGKILQHLFEDGSSAVIGAALRVHRALGAGFLEEVYQKALEVELAASGLRFDRQWPVEIRYRGQPIGLHRLDLLVETTIVVELKAVHALLDLHHAQLLSYLRATGLHVGLLLNFNSPVLQIRRIVA